MQPVSRASAPLPNRDVPLPGGWRILGSLTRPQADEIFDRVGQIIAVPDGSTFVQLATSLKEAREGQHCLGMGAFGAVCIGFGRGEYVGLKLGSVGRREAEIQEALKGLAHVLQVRATLEVEGERIQVMDLAGLGSLERIIAKLQELDTDFREQVEVYLAREMIAALCETHEKGFLHNDVKPSNFLVDHNGGVKLCDFGCASAIADGVEMGDEHFAAPEVWLKEYEVVGEIDGVVADSWALGVTLWELFSGKDFPIDRSWMTVMCADVRNAQARLQSYFEELLEEMPTGGKWDLVRQLLTLDPMRRSRPETARWNDWVGRRIDEGQVAARLSEFVQAQRAGSRPLEMPLPPTSTYVERPELEARVRGQLFSSQLTVCYGLPGAGKSELASRLLHSDEVKAQFRPRFWIRGADSASAVEQQLHLIACGLNLAEQQTPFQEAFEALQRHFSVGGPRWLMIFDNGGDPEMLRRYFLAGNGATLVTTRSTGWSGAIEVGAMAHGEAHQLVADLLPSPDPDVTALCALMNNCPLALMQACAYIRERALSIAQYVAQFQDGDAATGDRELLGRALPYTIARMYELTLDVVRRDPSAMATLQQLACLNPDDLEGHPLLEKYGLLQKNSDGSYRMHRLVGEIVRKKASPAEMRRALHAAAAGLADGSITHEARTLEEYTGARKRLPHSATMFPLAKQWAGGEVSLGLAAAMLLTGYATSGQRRRLGELVGEIEREILPGYGPKSQERDLLYLTIARCQKIVGDVDAAIAAMQKCMELRPEGDEDRGRGLAELAELYLQSDRDDYLMVACRLFRQALDHMPNSDRTKAKALLGLAQATLQHEKATTLDLDFSPRSNPELEGQIGQAIAILEGEDEGLEEALVLQGRILVGLRREEEAVAALERALRAAEARRGKDEVYVAQFLNHLGITLADLGRADEALPHLRRSDALVRRHLGEDHAQRIIPLEHLARIHLERNEFDQAMPYADEAFRIAETDELEDLVREVEEGRRLEEADPITRLTLERGGRNRVSRVRTPSPSSEPDPECCSIV